MAEGLLPPNTRRRERTLVYGGYKIGKSSLWVDILNTFYLCGQRDLRFYLIDSDNSFEELIVDEYPHLLDTEMVVLYNPSNFTEFMDASKEIRVRAKRGDWIVPDLLSQPWEAAHDHYISNVYGEEPVNYFIQMRKEVEAADDKDPRSYGGHKGVNWQFITKTYMQFEHPVILRSKANVFAVTDERKIRKDVADAEKLKRFKGVGLMEPVGQKGIGHRLSTVLRMTQKASGQRQLTLVGDRGREKTLWPERVGGRVLDIDEPPNSFVQRYLVDVAGWTLEMPGTGGRRRRRRSEGTGEGEGGPVRRRRRRR